MSHSAGVALNTEEPFRNVSRVSLAGESTGSFHGTIDVHGLSVSIPNESSPNKRERFVFYFSRQSQKIVFCRSPCLGQLGNGRDGQEARGYCGQTHQSSLLRDRGGQYTLVYREKQ